MSMLITAFPCPNPSMALRGAAYHIGVAGDAQDLLGNKLLILHVLVAPRLQHIDSDIISIGHKITLNETRRKATSGDRQTYVGVVLCHLHARLDDLADLDERRAHAAVHRIV